MARGYCSHCAQLVPIAPGEVDPRGGGRERVWRPLAHRDAQGRQCVGIHEAAGNVEFPLDEAPKTEPVKIRIDTSDPEVKAIWDAAVKAAEEVASWPPWKRGEG